METARQHGDYQASKQDKKQASHWLGTLASLYLNLNSDEK